MDAQAIQSLDPRGCVAVAEVRRDSPAWDAGLRVGQCVSHVGERRVTTPAEFFEAVEQATGDVALRMTNPEGDAPIRWVRAPE